MAIIPRSSEAPPSTSQSVQSAADTDELASIAGVEREIERLTKLKSALADTRAASDRALLVAFLAQTRDDASEKARAAAADAQTAESDQLILAGSSAELPGKDSAAPSAHRAVQAHLDTLQQAYFASKHDLDGLIMFSRILGRIGRCRASPIRTLRASGQIVSSVAWSRDGDKLAAAGTSRTIRVYDAREWETQFPVLDLRGSDKFSDVAFSPYSRATLLASDYRGVISLFDTLRGSRVRAYDEHAARVWSVGWSVLEPSVFASGGDDCMVKLWSNKARRSSAAIDLHVCSTPIAL